MKITPHYDGPPVICIDGSPGDVGDAFVRQRTRMNAALGALTDDDWRTPSRCDGWTVQDVAAHLVGVNQFWHLSMASGLNGEPTRFLVGFDPKATPASMVEAARAQSPSETFEQLVASSNALFDLVGGLDDAGWSTVAETPPGHLPIRLLAHHALWDAWVHERDVLLPLGVEPAEESDEILPSLRYSAALGPGFALMRDHERTGTLAFELTDPDARIVVRVDGVVRVLDGGDQADVVLRGPAVDVLEMVSVRTPFDQPVPDEHRWLVEGLANAFRVNFVAHAVVAGSPAPFAFGAMVPDLSKLVGGAPLDPHDEVEAGIRSHHVVDGAFHDHPTFKAWMRVVRDELGGTRIAYAAAHVGVELAMDGVLLERSHTAAFDGAVTWALGELDGRWHEVADRMPEIVDAYRTPAGVARRTAGAISRRPRLSRLALDERDLARAIGVVLPDVESGLDELLASLT